jgi:hypothetical protein
VTISKSPGKEEEEEEEEEEVVALVLGDVQLTPTIVPLPRGRENVAPMSIQKSLDTIILQKS